ncbi:MAG: ATP-dependent helicase HrpB [Acidimicrobiia bacterium]
MLPVESVTAELARSLAPPGAAAVLRAPPGAGKTTIVPLRLLDQPWLDGRVVVLEPRRLATRAAAARMAQLLGEPVGGTVGYRTRDDRRVGPSTRVEVVTEGILTRRLQHDPSLAGVALVVFDEVHERNLQTDLAMALALDARRSLRRDLRMLAMSATLDTDRIAALLGEPVTVLTSEGRQHPVDVRWAPPPPRLRVADATVPAVLRALREGEGDVLVFLPGAGDIRRVGSLLADGGALPDGVDVRPLFGALPVAEQDAALAPSPPGRRRVVLSTDIAETSLTVEGVRTVVDAGQVRTPRYDARTGLTRLQTGPSSKASADQRSGRAGRTAPGLAYRLWSKMEHAARRPYAEPEITVVDLAGFALELAVWGADVDGLSFLDPPPPRSLEEGRALLHMLGALDSHGRPTPEGRAMAELPLHPRLARMVTGARGWTACVLAALLEDRDVLRGRPDDVPVDVGERARLLDDRGARHPALDGAAVGSARRRAHDLARRVGVEPARVDGRECGLVLALAYPDRIAQARGGARFRLRNGSGAWVPRGDPLAGEAFLVVAELDADRRDSRVRMAAALDPADVEAAAGVPAERVAAVGWDVPGGELRTTVTRRIDGLVLATVTTAAPAGAEATASLLEEVRATRLGALRWTGEARSFQQRVDFLRRRLGDAWPDLSDESLLATVDEWLGPMLTGASRRKDLEKVDMAKVLRRRLGPRAGEIDELAPVTWAPPSGRRVPIDYAGDHPEARVRVQELFGLTSHPAVAGGRVPLVLHLLSPADRPVQVTADLPGFWAGSYASVRKDMAGRYPKHPWPADPARALPPPKGPGPGRPRKRR